jgi:hypothetical protein
MNAAIDASIRGTNYQTYWTKYYPGAPLRNPSGTCSPDWPTAAGTLQKVLTAGKIRWGYSSFAVVAVNATYGFFIDIAKDVTTAIGTHYGTSLTAEFVLVVTGSAGFFDTLYESLDVNYDLLIGTVITPPRALKVDFTCSIFDTAVSGVFSGLELPSGITTETSAELNNPAVKVGIQLGSAQEFTIMNFLPNATIMKYSTLAEVWTAVIAKNIHIAIRPKSDIDSWLVGPPAPCLGCNISSWVLSYDKTSFSANKLSAGSTSTTVDNNASAFIPLFAVIGLATSLLMF